jgi:hypothetical protein
MEKVVLITLAMVLALLPVLVIRLVGGPPKRRYYGVVLACWLVAIVATVAGAALYMHFPGPPPRPPAVALAARCLGAVVDACFAIPYAVLAAYLLARRRAAA